MVWDICAKKQIWVHASYINSSRNKVADEESRKLRDSLEWKLKEKLFEKILGSFDAVIIDVLSCICVNCKVNRYYSYNLQPESIGIDAFSYRRSNETLYAFPPFTIISQVLSKIKAEMGAGVLIVPLFTTQSWFTRLLRLFIHEYLLLPKFNTSLYFLYREKTMPTLPYVALIACLGSEKCRDKGISNEIAETIIQSWRPNAKSKYDTYRKQWLQFCSQRMCDSMFPTPVTVFQIFTCTSGKIFRL